MNVWRKMRGGLRIGASQSLIVSLREPGLIWRSIGFGNHNSLFYFLSSYDALAGTIEFIHQRNIPNARFELLYPGVGGWIIFQMSHYKFPATFFGCHIVQYCLNLGDGICRHRIVF
jgi:hypothetical protein